MKWIQACVWGLYACLLCFLMQLPIPHQGPFESIFFSGKSKELREWNKRYGFYPKYQFMHNLFRILPPEVYETHPEFFPVLDGWPYQPKSKKDQNWQPHFANEELSDYVAQRVIEYFKRNPTKKYYSIGMNDSNRFDESEETMEAIGELKYSPNGQPILSDLYFGFANRVAEIVAETYPDRKLGALAYLWLSEPPSFDLHPNLIVYLCIDSSQWYDKNYKADDIRKMEEWAKRCSTMGFYDYYNQDKFIWPRTPFKNQAEAITVASDLGYKGFHASVYPKWAYSEPVIEHARKTLQNPFYSDSSKELSSYFNRRYGAYAPSVGYFFYSWENAWSNIKKPGIWIKYYSNPNEKIIAHPELICGLMEELKRGHNTSGRYPHRYAYSQLIEEWNKSLDAISDSSASITRSGEDFPNLHKNPEWITKRKPRPLPFSQTTIPKIPKWRLSSSATRDNRIKLKEGVLILESQDTFRIRQSVNLKPNAHYTISISYEGLISSGMIVSANYALYDKHMKLIDRGKEVAKEKSRSGTMALTMYVPKSVIYAQISYAVRNQGDQKIILFEPQLLRADAEASVAAQ